MRVTALTHSISQPYIPPSHIHY